MQAKLRRLAQRYPDVIRAALQLHAEFIMTVSKRDFVPVDLGALRSSGHVRAPERGAGTTVSIELVFGGPAVPYAIRQHEDLTLRHTVGTAKYLERPLMAAVPTLARNIGRDIQLDRIPL